MTVSTPDFQTDELHPIDIVEQLAEYNEWDFDRVADDQIAMAAKGKWRTYSITIAWSAQDCTLRLICSFEMDPPKERLDALYETLNATNDMCWGGAFTFWSAQKLMIWRYGLVLAEGLYASPEQIDTMIRVAVQSSERFYPAFQLVCWGEETPEKAMGIAIAEAYGHA